MTRDEKVKAFRKLHKSGCFILPNPWDVMGARMLTDLGFQALATTSSGYAFSVGKEDHSRQVAREEALSYAEKIVSATNLPVTADLEDCYSESPECIVDTIKIAAEIGLVGVSIEDRNPIGVKPIRDFNIALERVQAAVEASRRYNIVLTARADGYGKKIYGLDETLRRLKAFEALGAEVLYAPGIPNISALEKICSSLNSPVNHVLGQGISGYSLKEIANVGVRRISLGGSLTRATSGVFLNISRSIALGDFTSLENAPSWNDLKNLNKLHTF